MNVRTLFLLHDRPSGTRAGLLARMHGAEDLRRGDDDAGDVGKVGRNDHGIVLLRQRAEFLQILFGDPEVVRTIVAHRDGKYSEVRQDANLSGSRTKPGAAPAAPGA